VETEAEGWENLWPKGRSAESFAGGGQGGEKQQGAKPVNSLFDKLATPPVDPLEAVSNHGNRIKSIFKTWRMRAICKRCHAKS
jgi:hypothetical protein